MWSKNTASVTGAFVRRVVVGVRLVGRNTILQQNYIPPTSFFGTAMTNVAIAGSGITAQIPDALHVNTIRALNIKGPGVPGVAPNEVYY